MQLLPIKPKIFEPHRKVATFFAVGKLKFGIAPKDEVVAERRELLRVLNLDARQMQGLEQDQTDQAYYLDDNNKTDFLSEPKLIGDALYTGKSGIYLSVTSADCLPILFYNSETEVVGAFHAGWPGTAKKTLTTVMRRIFEKFSAPIASYKFYFGPAAQTCCYDITDRPERAEIFKREFGNDVIVKRDGKIYLDFVKANQKELQDLGVSEGQIENSGICTIHNLEYPSYRRERKTRQGSLLSIIGLR